MRITFVLAAAIMILASGTVLAQTIGSAHINAPAVVLQNNTGIITTISLNVSSGNGAVTVTGPSEVAASTVDSARTAAQAGADYLGLSAGNYNFSYVIHDSTANVSGPSAGGAMAMLAVSALSGRQLRTDFTMTGTISANGSIGEIGGVYDKVGAAKADGLDLVLVPAVPSTSIEDELYLLAQDQYGIPVVQVANISQASVYAFSNLSGNGAETTYNFSTSHYPPSLPNAAISCSNNCNESAFGGLTAFTLGFVRSAVSKLGRQYNFTAAASQMSEALTEAQGLVSKGYDYAGADAAFLDYINAYFFLNHNATRAGGLQTLHSISDSCAGIYAPQMTNINYEYVIGGELRKGWAQYTLNGTISTYNATAIDSDGVLEDLYSGSTANAWCAAADYMFNSSRSMGGTPVVPSASIGSLAKARIQRAAGYGPSLYLATAQLAYNSGDYPVAVFDADYAYSFGSPSNGSTTGLLESARSLASSATYGIWASQFANEAMMYYYDAGAASNATVRRSDAVNAYQTALLASQLGNDTRNIFANLTPTNTTTTIPITTAGSGAPPIAAGEQGIIYILLGIIIVLLAALLAALAYIASRSHKRAKARGRGTRRKRRRRMT